MCVYRHCCPVMGSPPARPFPIPAGQAGGMGINLIHCGPQPSSVTTSLLVSFGFQEFCFLANLLCWKSTKEQIITAMVLFSNALRFF